MTWIEPIEVTAIKPGSFIGTVAVTQPDGTLKALEIQVSRNRCEVLAKATGRGTWGPTAA